MSVAKDLRRFLIDDVDITITQIAEGRVSELEDPDIGFIWFGRRGTGRARTFDQATEVPEQQLFDLEVYHPDPDVVEIHANALHKLDCYSGAFGGGNIQAFFVENQKDDYIQRVEFTDAVSFDSAFLSIEIRSHTAT